MAVAVLTFIANSKEWYPTYGENDQEINLGGYLIIAEHRQRSESHVKS